MTPFDRLAWRCSSLARGALLGALVGLGLHWSTLAADVLPSVVREFLPVTVVVLAFIGVVAHMVVDYHAVKAGTFPPHVDRSRLQASLQFDPGHRRWRGLMRELHPELRSRSSQHR